jgi:hypothetical protein
MAYVFALPKDVTDLIYAFRDPLSWNGDKHRTTPLGRLFKDSDLQVAREPWALYFLSCRGVIYKVESAGYDQEPPNITIWERVRSSKYCYIEAACIWLTDDVCSYTESARVCHI